MHKIIFLADIFRNTENILSMKKVLEMNFLKVWLPLIILLDKQQEVDINNLRLEEELSSGSSSTKQSTTKSAPLSTISGVKKPLGHTNSISCSATLPRFGVETQVEYEPELTKILENSEKWGIDMFRIDAITDKRTLTCVTYTIFQVSGTCPPALLLFIFYFSCQQSFYLIAGTRFVENFQNSWKSFPEFFADT